MNTDNRTPLRRAVDKLRADGRIKQDKDLQEIFNRSKSTISAYLSSPKPGKDFVIEFEKYFGVSLKEFEVNHALPKSHLDLKDKYIQSLEAQVEFLNRQLETNLNLVLSNQNVMVELMRDAAVRAAMYHFGSDKKKLDIELNEINKRIGGVLK